MATAFDATNAPFDRLTPQQVGAVEAALPNVARLAIAVAAVLLV